MRLLLMGIGMVLLGVWMLPAVPDDPPNARRWVFAALLAVTFGGVAVMFYAVNHVAFR